MSKYAAHIFLLTFCYHCYYHLPKRPSITLIFIGYHPELFLILIFNTFLCIT